MTQQNNWQQGVWHADAPAAQPQAQPQQPQVPQAQPQAQPQVAYAQPQTAYGQNWGQPQAAYAHPQAQAAYAAQAQPAPYASADVAQQPKKRGWIVALAVIVAVLVLCLAGIASCTSMVNSSMNSFGSLGSFGFAEPGQEMAYDDTVGIIELGGTIQYDGSVCSPEGLKEQLDRAEEDPNIVAVVLRVDSGGGTATAGEEMANYVRDFSKPIVVSSASINASAAYEISSQADYIFVAKTTAIGSIGTAMQITDLSGLYEKLGINVENITSSDSKDSSYGTRALSEEERAWYQDQVDQINETFIETVAEGRGMDIEDVRKLANGMTYTGMDAVENGLADEIGGLEDAVLKACEIAGAPADCDTMYLNSGSYYDLYSLFGLTEGEASAEDIAAALKELEQHVGFEG
ncbi:MAG: signal peptide peptidase SppA [Eggerthellaceae bacterium]|nr:signal peptide peptidase SppA [Eggerthellaceae bacterium]